MGRKTKYAIRGVNFGEEGNHARLLMERFVKLHGKVALSKYVRKLIIISLYDNPAYQDWKIKVLVYDRKELSKNIAKLAAEREHIDSELRKLGQNPDEIV